MSHPSSPPRRTPPRWRPDFVPELAIFDDLRHRFSSHLPHHWPDPQTFNDLASARNAHFDDGRPLRFTVQQQALSALGFERFIAEHGRIPMRPSNWHDVFNALMWLTFTRSKCRLNQLHVSRGESVARSANRRDRRRDFATLLDEAGLIIAYPSSPGHTLTDHSSAMHSASARVNPASMIPAQQPSGKIDAREINTGRVNKGQPDIDAQHDGNTQTTPPAPGELNRRHQWQALFLHHRSHWWHEWYPMIIGHGLYEQCLTPYIGLTAKALYLAVDTAFNEQPMDLQYQILDTRLSAFLEQPEQTHPRQLLPLPVLGIPGWWQDNANPSFYSNTDYFRPSRATRQTT